MAKFGFNFSGYCKVEAENIDEAEKKFWLWYNPIQLYPGVTDDVVTIEFIEEDKDEEG